MKAMNKGKIIVISGPSGCGKGTVISRLLKMDASFKLSVSMTTRAPREGEADGREYYFVSKQEFKRRILSGDLLEYTCYNGNYYGTPLKEISHFQEQGITILLDIEIEGAANVRKAKPDNLITIFLAPPSFEVLRERLIGRGTESMDVIEKRLERAKTELEEQDKYDYIVVNDCLDEAVKQIYEIIKQ